MAHFLAQCQKTWAKRPKHAGHYDVTHRKPQTQNKSFLNSNNKTSRIRKAGVLNVFPVKYPRVIKQSTRTQ